MDLKQLNYFLVCAQKGSLTRAAEELYTTQPHMSQTIRALEWELGIKLFHRTGAGVTLTSEGEKIRFYAENVLKNAQMIRQAAREKNEKDLKVAANPSSRLAFWMTELFSVESSIGLTLQYTECGIEQMMDLLESGQYDIGVLFLPTDRLTAFHHMSERKHLVFTPLLYSDLVVHCGEKGPFYGKQTIRPEELNGCRCIQFEDDFFALEDLLQEDRSFRSGKYSIQKTVRTNSDHLMVRMLEETGLCNIGSYWYRPANGPERFSISLIEGFRKKVAFGCLRSNSRQPDSAETDFLELLKKEMQKQGSFAAAEEP